ncbi:MAG: CoA pyrophosphatase [Bacteroidetes bacterium SW_9_63_38]|nr:MAG: CoA pyrophosphatase [Bacteroidetes bacterium SW_9_63_38]
MCSRSRPSRVPICSYNAFIDCLSARLAQSLPGHDVHATMAPRHSARQDALSVDRQACREAGVLALLLPEEERPVLVLTARHDELSDHSGQISFPGGRREGDETLSETALREADEEIGLSPTTVRLLGALTPLYIPPSNFCVHPFVGAAARALPLHPTDREVNQILRVPLDRLLAPETRVVEPWTLHEEEVEVPYYDVEGHTVWGATAMMIAELLATLRSLLDPD